MKIIQGSRCSGKTTAAVKIALSTNQVLVVKTMQISINLKRHNPGLRSMGFEQFMRTAMVTNHYIIDDIEGCFGHLGVTTMTTSFKCSKRLKQFTYKNKNRLSKKLKKYIDRFIENN